MKFQLFKGKSKRTKVLGALTVLGIAVVIALNLFLTAVGHQRTLFFDMTPEDLYTLTDAMVEECAFVDELPGDGEKVTITFCNDPDYLISSDTTRYTYYMALKLANMFDNIEVETVNVRLNPTAVSKYKVTSLTEINGQNIIVSYKDRFRVTTAQKFWVMGTSENLHYNGEYRMATLIRSVTAIEQPVAYFVIDHGETYFDPENPESEMSLEAQAFYELLLDRGLQVKTLMLSEVERIPEDCALLVINNPKTDFTYDESQLGSMSYVSDTEKIDRYLVMHQGAVMVSHDNKGENKTPVLDVFLREWGFEFDNGIIKDEEFSLDDSENSYTNIIAQYNKDETSYGYALYGPFADLSSAPLTVFPSTGGMHSSFKNGFFNEAGAANTSKRYASFLTTSENAALYKKNPDSGEFVDRATDFKQLDIAAVTVRSETDLISSETTYSYVFCANSPDFFSSDVLYNTSYANYDILSAVVDNISRIDDFASMDLGGLSLNSASGGGKKIITMKMSEDDVTVYSNKYIDGDSEKGMEIIKFNHGITTTAIVIYSVFIFAIPVGLAILGIVIRIKRRYL